MVRHRKRPERVLVFDFHLKRIDVITISHRPIWAHSWQLPTCTRVLLEILLHLELHVISLKWRIANGLICVHDHRVSTSAVVLDSDCFDLDRAWLADKWTVLVMDVRFRVQVSLSLFPHTLEHSVNLALLVDSLFIRTWCFSDQTKTLVDLVIAAFWSYLPVLVVFARSRTSDRTAGWILEYKFVVTINWRICPGVEVFAWVLLFAAACSSARVEVLLCLGWRS